MAGGLNGSATHTDRARNLIDDTWRQLRDSFLWRVAEGQPISSFSDLSEAESDRKARRARGALKTIDDINLATLPHQLALSVQVARSWYEVEAKAPLRYWLAQDYGTFPAIFPVGPYGSGYVFNIILRVFSEFEFTTLQDCDRYLGLIDEFVRFIEQVHTKLREQAAQDIRIPRPSLPGVRALLAKQSDKADRGLRPNTDRLTGIASAATFVDRVARSIETNVVPSLKRLLDLVGDEYAAGAPQGVGLAQYRGGGEIYESLADQHMTIRKTPEAVHRDGHDRILALEDAMASVRAALGFVDRASFHRYLLEDPVWVATSWQQLQDRFDGAIRRIEPRLAQFFNFGPVAKCRAARLDMSLEAAMTYGYYQEPMSGHPDGVYYFNGSNVSERTLATAPSLIYHELIPGHHFHIASQKENPHLHPLRQSMLFNAFNEGWAEYAATLAGEMGMYADPREQYGRLLMDSFLTCRLVVDTGMNVFGWSLEQARQYMRDHTVMSEAEIQSESLRYSTDIPAQSLAYKIGEMEIQSLRQHAKKALDDRFDIRDFHDAVLGSGAMPLDVLRWHVDAWISARIAGRSFDLGRPDASVEKKSPRF